MIKAGAHNQSAERSSSHQGARSQEPSPAFEPQPLDLDEAPLQGKSWKRLDARPLQARLRPRPGAQPPLQRSPDPERDARRAHLRRDTSDAPLQRRGDDAPTSPEISPPSGGGEAMPAPVQAKMESAFGQSFSDVRLHQGSHVSELGAEAYTQGSDIHFAPGRLDTASPAGQGLLGHELTHVVQQRAGRVSPDSEIGGMAANTSPALEAEADTLGARAAAHAPAQAATPAAGSSLAPGSAGAPVQRKASAEDAPVQMQGGPGAKGKKRKAHTPQTNSVEDIAKVYGVDLKAKNKKKTPKKKPSDDQNKHDDDQNKHDDDQNKHDDDQNKHDDDQNKHDDDDQNKHDDDDQNKHDDDQSQGGGEEDEQEKGPVGRGLSLLKDALMPGVKKAVDDEREAQRLAKEEAERLTLQQEIDDALSGLKGQVRGAEQDLGDGLKTTHLEPVMIERVFPVISKNLFTKEQGIAAKAIAKERGGELEAAYKEQLEVSQKEAAETAQGSGKATDKWKSIKATKAAETGKNVKGSKDQMAKEFARQSVEDQLKGRAAAHTETAWKTLGEKTWKSLPIAALGGITFPGLLGRVDALKPAETDLSALKAAKARILQEETVLGNLLDKARDKTRSNVQETTLNKKNLEKIEGALKKDLNLSFFSSGKDEDRKEINHRAKDDAAKKDVQMKVAGTVAKVQLESSLAGFSGSLGKMLSNQVPTPGDFCSLEVALKIPVYTGVKIVLMFKGELERDDAGVSVKLNGQLGASAGIEKLFTVQATFGGYIEAKGRDGTHALEMMSYSFYQRSQGKLPSGWYDKIWGVGGTVLKGEEAKTWAGYVEEKMKAGDYVESGLMAEVGGEIGDKSVLGASAKLTGKTGTRWGKEEDAGDVQKDSVMGANLSLGLNAGAIGVAGTLDFGYRRVQAKSHEFAITGEASLDKSKLGIAGGKLFDAVKNLTIVANEKLAGRLAKDPEAKRSLDLAANDKSFSSVFQGAFADGAVHAYQEEYGDQEKLEESVTEASLGDTQIKRTTRANEGTAETDIGALNMKEKKGNSLSLVFELKYNTQTGWGGDILFKEGTSLSVDVGGVLTADLKSGHKYSLKNNALSKARRADKAAIEERQA